jgi:hypothetical protein
MAVLPNGGSESTTSSSSSSPTWQSQASKFLGENAIAVSMSVGALCIAAGIYVMYRRHKREERERNEATRDMMRKLRNFEKSGK